MFLLPVWVVRVGVVCVGLARVGVVRFRGWLGCCLRLGLGLRLDFGLWFGFGLRVCCWIRLRGRAAADGLAGDRQREG